MRDFVVKATINGLGLWLAAWLVPGIGLGDSPEWTDVLRTVALVSLVFALVNTLIKPIAKLLSLPLILLTLGLFSLVVNAAMLQLTSWLSGRLGLAFHVESFFWDAILGAIVVTFVSMILTFFDPADR